MNIKNTLLLISVTVLFTALIDGWSYEFFTLLRFIVSSTTAYLAWLTYRNGKENWTWALGAIAILFNPLLPIYLTREIWVVIDFITAIFLLFTILKLK